MQCSSLEKNVWSVESYSKLHTHLLKIKSIRVEGDNFKKNICYDRNAVRIEDAGSFSFDRKFLRNFPVKQNAPRRMRTRAIGIMSQKRPRSARESRKRDSFLYLHGGYFAQNNERHEA